MVEAVDDERKPVKSLAVITKTDVSRGLPAMLAPYLSIKIIVGNDNAGSICVLKTKSSKNNKQRMTHVQRIQTLHC
jgi:hypothetical protein